MLATLIDEPFDSDEWIFEIKWDGFRAIAVLNKRDVKLYSRNQKLFNSKFPLLIKHLQNLKLQCTLDGEIVALDPEGLSHFQLLQNPKEEEIYYYVFDILSLNGKDLRRLPLIERKRILKRVLKKDARIRYLDHVEAKGKAFFEECKRRGVEGIIGKRTLSPYLSGKRSGEWVKIKALENQEVVICGFTEPKKSRKNFGALIVGVYKNKRLVYAGHVGGGFTENSLREIKKRLLPLVTKKCPFEERPKTNTPVTWVKPQLLAQVKFREWTEGGNMRQPIFLGLRTDKSAKSVIRERKQKYTFFTNIEKVFWKKEGITKGDLLEYYESISSYMLPHLKDRPESLKRFPNGISSPSFFQKNFANYPEWISTVSIEHSDKMINYLVIQEKESLLYAVNLAAIEIHPWLSRHQTLDYPDYLVFDLDPQKISFDAVINTANVLHDILEELNIDSYPKTSGGRGLHIAVPLKAKYSYEQAKQFALLIANLVHQNLPKIVSLERNPKKRLGKVYIDCFQNNFGQTIVAPYSVRAKEGALVSTPLSWSEVKKGLDPKEFTLFNTPARLKKKGDLYKGVLGKGIDMMGAISKLRKVIN